MSFIRKYGFVLALAVAVIYAYVPLTRDDIAKLRWLDDVNVIVNKSLALAKPQVGVSPVDPIAAANVDEDLDYRIAQRTKSPERWRESSESGFTSLLTITISNHAHFSRHVHQSTQPPNSQQSWIGQERRGTRHFGLERAA